MSALREATVPHYEDGGLRLWHGPNMEILPTFADASFDSIVTDPPYELGFMGKGWDSSGIAYDVDVWRECLRVLKPGGHLLAFGGSRTWHRMAVAIEDAGFEMRDSIAWLYGSGFPKSLDVAKAIDKTRDDRAEALTVAAWLAAQRDASGLTNRDIDQVFGFSGMAGHWTARADMKIVQVPRWDQWQRLRDLIGFGDEMDAEVWRLNGRKGAPGDAWASAEVIAEEARMNEPSGIVNAGQGVRTPVVRQIKAPNSEAAREWEGWGTALKPAFEPIVVARKPLQGTVAANVLEHGTGALNIDATRIAHRTVNGGNLADNPHLRGPKTRSSGVATGFGKAGEESENTSSMGRWPTNVILDGSQAEALDTQTGVLTSGVMKARTNREPRKGGVIYGADKRNIVAGDTYGDSGGASRFFPTFDLTPEDVAWQARLEALPTFRYEAKAPTSERPNVDGTVHATVKPLALIRWLVRLVTCPGGRVLDLYSGSGTTGEAALLEGMEVDLIELEEAHLPLILARVRKPLHPAMFGDWEDAS